MLLGKSLVIYRLFGDLLGPGQADQLSAEASRAPNAPATCSRAIPLLNNTGAEVLLTGDLPAARARLERRSRRGARAWPCCATSSARSG